MTEFRTFDLGRVLSQGENILAARQRRDPNSPENQIRQLQLDSMRRDADPSSPGNRLRDLQIQQAETNNLLQNAEIGFRGFSEIAANPAMAETWGPVLAERGLAPPFDPNALSNPERLSAKAAEMASQYEQLLTRQRAATTKPRASKLLTPEELAQQVTLARERGAASSEAAITQAAEVARLKEAARIRQEQRKVDRERQQTQPKDTAKVEAAQQKTTMLNQTIDEAKDMAGFWTTGLLGQALENLGGTDAHDLQQTLNTIKANIGFDRLQEMRDNSKTGGALGAVSERENKLLQQVWSSLEQSQSTPKLKANLEKVRKAVRASQKRLEAAYRQRYGSGRPRPNASEAQRRDYDLVFGNNAGGASASVEASGADVTLMDPETGERYIRRNGQVFRVIDLPYQ